MPAGQSKNWTFNTVADTYEKIRPGYPEELYRTLFAYAPLDAMMERYRVSSLKDGWNTVDGEEIYFISNPALGLWAHPDRFED